MLYYIIYIIYLHFLFCHVYNIIFNVYVLIGMGLSEQPVLKRTLNRLLRFKLDQF